MSGRVQQVLVNKRSGFVVDGHARAALALSRGEMTVPVLYVDLEPEEEEAVSRYAQRDDGTGVTTGQCERAALRPPAPRRVRPRERGRTRGSSSSTSATSNT